MPTKRFEVYSLITDDVEAGSRLGLTRAEADLTAKDMNGDRRGADKLYGVRAWRKDDGDDG